MQLETPINKRSLQQRFGKYAHSYKEQATVQKNICTRFVLLLVQLPFAHKSVLEIGCGTGFLTENFLQKFTVESYTANDIVVGMEAEIANVAKKTRQNIQFISGDAESLHISEMFDCVLSTSTVQWLHNLPQFFKNIVHNVNSSGIFAFTTFGMLNFREISACSGQSLNYYSVEELRDFLAENFDILHCESYCETLFFETPVAVLRHIKQTGVNNLASGRWTKARLQSFSEKYCAQFSSQNNVSLTYNPIIIIARKK